MLFAKYLFSTIGFGLLLAAAGILIYDLYQMFRHQIFRPRTPEKKSGVLFGDIGAENEQAAAPPGPVRWRIAGQAAGIGMFSVLIGLSITVVPSGQAGVEISQWRGTLPGTLYPGVHWTTPLMERVELFNTRDRVFTSSLMDDPKAKTASLRVQTKEGLSVGLAVTVRFKLDPAKLAYIYSNLPQPVEEELVPPTVGSLFRQAAPNYTVREMFSSRREEMVRAVAGQIAQKLAPDGVVVKEVMLRDIQLPVEYAKGMEGLLLKEQENERISIEMEVKQKMVRVAELEAEAQKARDIKDAEAKAQVTVLEAKAEADAMQHTLPLKEKQIQQSKLEAEARKESTVMNAEAAGQAKVIDGKAELERRKLQTEGESDRIRHVAAADAERMRLEAEVLTRNPLLIQKIIAEKLSDKVQIMMVPNDGKFFFANDVLKGAATAAAVTKDQ
ncbi:MAG TPA: SPFH domain-containing protein [Bryobacteraceae bacterium]|nr:SPFH domain-containing protein [Bryobacteraceae bacterium]